MKAEETNEIWQYRWEYQDGTYVQWLTTGDGTPLPKRDPRRSYKNYQERRLVPLDEVLKTIMEATEPGERVPASHIHDKVTEKFT